MGLHRRRSALGRGAADVEDLVEARRVAVLPRDVARVVGRSARGAPGRRARGSRPRRPRGRRARSTAMPPRIAISSHAPLTGVVITGSAIASASSSHERAGVVPRRVDEHVGGGVERPRVGDGPVRRGRGRRRRGAGACARTSPPRACPRRRGGTAARGRRPPRAPSRGATVVEALQPRRRARGGGRRRRPAGRRAARASARAPARTAPGRSGRVSTPFGITIVRGFAAG